jgi:LmbE family N-acetylglucosaminyl deacetylase
VIEGGDALEFHHDSADLFIPDRIPEDEALSRTTHIGIGAHQDDLEIMAYHGIVSCYARGDLWFGGVTCTNGSGSSRIGPYAHATDGEMARIRHAEQRKAAFVGDYSFVAQLGYSSTAIKDPQSKDLENDLFRILDAARPSVVYTHNPADKHASHIAVAIPAILAMRRLPRSLRPERVYGCEVWRNLDWLADEDKCILDVTARPNLAAALIGIYDSQVSGGKRYDLAAVGRWRANATFLDSHGSDTVDGSIYAMDLTALIEEPTRDIADWVLSYIDRFRADVKEKIARQLGG